MSNGISELCKDVAKEFWQNNYRKLGDMRRSLKDSYYFLPVDEDGIPIHIGDEMQCHGSGFKVIGFGEEDGDDVVFCNDDDRYCCYAASECNHHVMTVRDTVEELVSETYTCGWIDGSNDTFSYDTNEIVEKYTKRLEER